MNIRRSMYQIVCLLILVPLLLFSLLISTLYSNKLKSAITDSLRAVANAQLGEMAGFCEQQMNNLKVLGDMDVSHAALRGQLNKSTLKYLDNILYSRVQTTDHLLSTTILDPGFRIVACSEQGYALQANEGIEQLIDKMGEDSFYISDVLSSSLADGQERKSVVAISRAEENGELLGYILAEIDLGFYQSVRERVELWNDSTFYLLDGSQNIITAGTASTDRQSFVTTKKERSDYIRKYHAIDIEANPQGSFSYHVGGRHYITYYSNVVYTDWQILLTVDLDNYLQERLIYGILVISLIILCGIIALCVGGFASRRIVRPIGRISDTLNKIRQTQDYTLRVNVDHRDEIGKLSMEINGLLDFIETENLYKVNQQRLLQEKADQDALTKALNKEKINLYLRESLERHQSDRSTVCVLFIDIDDFKDFNTHYGHNTGDQVLLFITRLLTQQTGGTVGRVGGDEFLVVMEDPAYIAKLESCLEQIQELSRNSFMPPGMQTPIPVTCCIGALRIDFSLPAVSVLPSVEYLTHLADSAMYEAKNSGKERHVILDFEG